MDTKEITTAKFYNKMICKEQEIINSHFQKVNNFFHTLR
jgi:hypothetical protein